MALEHSTNIIKNGLTFYYDMSNTWKSWQGAPTTNLVGSSMSIYNNVPGDVTASLVATNEYYRDAQVWQLTLTPTTATGVGYLTNGNNPGIGVVTSGGGGLANRFTGHAIFYRSTVPLHSTPLFTNYSNISGWGAGALGSNRSVSMGDGWSRGEVLFFNASTQSDGKYWAINPASATLNVPIVIFWAGPFKEDRNDSNHVAAYTPGTRSSTQSIIDMTNNSVPTVNNLSYNSSNNFNFIANDATSTITVPLSASFNKLAGTISMWVNPAGYSGSNGLFVNRDVNTANAADWFWIGSWDSANVFYFRLGDGTTCCNNDLTISNWASVCPTNTWTYVTCSWTSAGQSRIYTNGVLRTSRSISAIPSTNPSATGRIGLGHESPGSWNGRIGVTQIYNRQLTDNEILYNFNSMRMRYGV